MNSEHEAFAEDDVESDLSEVIPQNGAVVIIDDQPNEALPIVKALSKKGIATTYYQGNVENELPDEPIQSVRLLFLDLKIIETNDENVIAKSLINVLYKIIPDNNGPYLLVIWSKNYHTYADAVKSEILKHEILIPAAIVHFDKSACLERVSLPSIDKDGFIERLNDLLTGKLTDEDIETVADAVSIALADDVRTEFQAREDAINIIEKHLKIELKKAGSFHLFVIWENIIKKAGAKMVFEVTSLINKDEHWEVNACNILKRMGIARVGVNMVAEDIMIRESINTLNVSLIDNVEIEMKTAKLPKHITLENEIVFIEKNDSGDFSLRDVFGESEVLKDGVSLKKSVNKVKLRSSIKSDNKIDAEDKSFSLNLIDSYERIPASLNTKLHIELNPSQELIPGNIYLNPEQEKKEKYIGSFLKRLNGQLAEYILIDLEVSPICDYAQKKWKRSRTLPGLMYPAKYAEDKRSGGNIYAVDPSFFINGIEYLLIFDYHLFNAWDISNAKQKLVSYRLKRELLLDIIAQLSSHVNRPGISFIE